MSLKFKGEKTKKKKRSHKEVDTEDRGEGSSTGTVKERYGKNPEGWVQLLAQDDLFGPTFITARAKLGGKEHHIALASNPINHKAYPFPLTEGQTAEEGEPTTVDTIWRCARIPESEDKITFKSAQDRYLAVDQVGEVSAEREARGAQEEFILERVEEKGKGAFAVRSAAWGKYLSIDEVVGGKLALRCDVETVGDDEVWYFKMQAEFLGKMEEEKRKRQRQMQPDDGLVIIGDLRAAEEANIRKYQARVGSQHATSSETLKALKKAKAEGRMAEEMLDRRRKLKSDRYC